VSVLGTGMVVHYGNQCRAAIVTEAPGGPVPKADLCVITTGGMFFRRDVPHEPGHDRATSWHWPEWQETDQ
jgi:hypothetical protein